MKKEKVIRIILILVIVMLLIICFKLSNYNHTQEDNKYFSELALVEDGEDDGCRPLNGK